MFFSKVPFGSRLAKRSEASACDGIGQLEFVLSEEIDVTPGNGVQVGDIGGIDLLSAFTEPVQGLLHVDGVPVYDGVEGQAEAPELFLLSLAKWTSDFAALPVINASAEPVAKFFKVELYQDASAECRVVDIVQDVQRLDDAARVGREFGPADIGQAWTEPVTEQPEQAKDRIGIGGRVAHDLQRLEFSLLVKQKGEEDEAVAQGAGSDGGIQTAELIGDHVVSGHPSRLSNIFGIGLAWMAVAGAANRIPSADATSPSPQCATMGNRLWAETIVALAAVMVSGRMKF